MGNVIKLNLDTTVDIPVNDVLDGAKDKGIERVTIIGRMENGEYYFASSIADATAMLWDVEQLKKELLQ